jgi:hypothetical protein
LFSTSHIQYSSRLYIYICVSRCLIHF